MPLLRRRQALFRLCGTRTLIAVPVDRADRVDIAPVGSDAGIPPGGAAKQRGAADTDES